MDIKVSTKRSVERIQNDPKSKEMGRGRGKGTTKIDEETLTNTQRENGTRKGGKQGAMR